MNYKIPNIAQHLQYAERYCSFYTRIKCRKMKPSSAKVVAFCRCYFVILLLLRRIWVFLRDPESWLRIRASTSANTMRCSPSSAPQTATLCSTGWIQFCRCSALFSLSSLTKGNDLGDHRRSKLPFFMFYWWKVRMYHYGSTRARWSSVPASCSNLI